MPGTVSVSGNLRRYSMMGLLLVLLLFTVAEAQSYETAPDIFSRGTTQPKSQPKSQPQSQSQSQTQSQFQLQLQSQSQSQSQTHTVLFPGLSGQQLLDSVRVHYKPATVLSYNSARDQMYRYVDNFGGIIECLYTGYTGTVSTSSTTPRADALDQNINAEHIFPQSKGALTGNANSDLHHLQPANANVNSSRGNLPFGVVPTGSVNRWWGVSSTNVVLSPTVTPSGDLTVWSRNGGDRFEPRDAFKGNVARSVFYFFGMYTEEAWAADSTFFAGMREILLGFHRGDPVDEREWTRTYRAAEFQQGRINPFILDTSLVARIFFAGDVIGGSGGGSGGGSDEVPDARLVASYAFAGTTGCSVQDNAVTGTPAGVVFGDFSRTGVLCNDGAVQFNTREWTVGGTGPSDVAGSEKFVGFTMTARTDTVFSFTDNAVITVRVRRSATGPVSAQVRLVAGDETVILGSVAVTESDVTHTFVLPEWEDLSAAEVRIYAWGGSNTGGTFRVTRSEVQYAVRALEPVGEPGHYVYRGVGNPALAGSWGERVDGSGAAPAELVAGQVLRFRAGGAVPVASEWVLRGNLILESGELQTNGNLVLETLADGSGAWISREGTGRIEGPVTTRRTISSTAEAGAIQYFMLGSAVSAPFAGSGGLFGSVWTQGAPGATVSAGSPHIWSYDASYVRSGAGDTGGWLAVPDLSMSMTPGFGYLAAIFTNDSPGVAGSWPKVLSATGNLRGETFSDEAVVLPVSFVSNVVGGEQLGGFNLVANPFPSAVDWTHSSWTRTRVGSAYWALESNGTFSAYSIGDGGAGSATGQLLPNQAFWVRATGADPQLALRSAASLSGTVNTGVGLTSSKQTVNSNNRINKYNNEAASVPVLGFNLRGEGPAGTGLLRISLRSSAEIADLGEGVALMHPISATYSIIFTKDAATGEPLFLRRVSREATEVITMPLAIASTSAGEIHLLPEDIQLPSGWMIALRVFGSGLDLCVWDAAEAGQPCTVSVVAGTVMEPDSGYELALIPPGVTSVIDGGGRELPREVSLSQNWPNPFNPTTRIAFNLPEMAHVRLTVFDLLGRQVAVLSDAPRGAGIHTVDFDATAFSSGVYVYQLRVTNGSGSILLTRKMTVLK
jgi:hypothetical protein